MDKALGVWLSCILAFRKERVQNHSDWIFLGIAWCSQMPVTVWMRPGLWGKWNPCLIISFQWTFFCFPLAFFSFSFSLLDILFFNLFILFFSFLETEFHVVPAGFNLFCSRGKSWTLIPLFLPPKHWDSRHEVPPLALTVFLTEIQIHLRIQKCIIRHVLCADIHAYVHGGYWSTSSVILWEIQSYFCETESLTGLWGLPVGYTNYLVSLKDPLVSTSPIITSSCYSLLLSTWVLRIEL